MNDAHTSSLPMCLEACPQTLPDGAIVWVTEDLLGEDSTPHGVLTYMGAQRHPLRPGSLLDITI